MLTEPIICTGKPIAKSNLTSERRIDLLTDISSENCKNFFQNIFVIEKQGDNIAFHFLEVGTFEKENFKVDPFRKTSFPIFYPNGGNPLHAQGVYPIPCFLMYESHIKGMNDPHEFAKSVLLPRLNNTIPYQHYSQEQKEELAQLIAKLLRDNYDSFIQEEKQLGILFIYDEALPIYNRLKERKGNKAQLWIAESKLVPGEHLFLSAEHTLQNIITSKFEEAKTLGYEKKAISTFTNQVEEEVVSIYNKSWLWLSPTWDMPTSIHWGKTDWTRGIKIDRENYEYFLYGVQFLKKITVPISSAILKEMFAPIMNHEAKAKMKATNFESIYGFPLVLPLVDGDSQQLYEKYRKILENKKLNDSELHLEILAGIKRMLPPMSDEHRLNIIYYSGDLSRGNMHIRMVIEDVIPSVAVHVQKIMREMHTSKIPMIQQIFGIEEERELYKVSTLPSLLANAFGPGYIWSTLQAVLHKKQLRLDRIIKSTSLKLNELANKEELYAMRYELAFYYSFIEFHIQYHTDIVGVNMEVKTMNDWKEMLDSYYKGEVESSQLQSPEELGFISGLLLKQFSQSYYAKTGTEFIKKRVMKFGSKLTPKMVWKNGIMRCEELAYQWDLGLSENFHSVLAVTMIGLLEANEKNWFISEKDRFITAFWSGYLMYQKRKNEKDGEGDGNDENK